MIEVGPDSPAAVRERLGLTAAEARLLTPDHPFLRVGRWRGFAVEHEGALVARLLASLDPRQRDPAGGVGCVGFVRLASPTTNPDRTDQAGRAVLTAAVEWLRSEGASTIRGPVQLSTWYGHRAMTSGFPDETRVPALPLEPAPEHRLPELLGDAGFQPVHRAVSCLVDSATVVAGTAGAVRRARRAGIRDRPIHVADLDGELRLLQRLADGIFEGTWALSPITFAEFASIYRPLDGQVDPELIRILESADGTPIGFALGLRTAAPGGTFVLKTLGVTAEARRHAPGVGSALIGIVHRVAMDGGAERGVHALMTVGSAGHRLSLRWGSEFRSYATYELATR